MKLYYSHILGIDFSQVLVDVLKKKPNEVVLFLETEWFLPMTKEFIDVLKDNGVILRVVTGAFKDQYYKEHCELIGLDIANVEFWGTHWLNWSFPQLNIKPDIRTDFKFPFISMNNRSHLHRCVFMDEMAKNDLLDKGAVTWIKHLNENSNYPFQYFDNKVRKFNDGFSEKLDSFLIPNEFHESFFHVITEATSHLSFLTEKTAIPILLKKPFMVLSGQGFSSRLSELGFELYDELIDYSYDEIADLQCRVERFVGNIQKITNCDIQEMQNILKPKIEHNYSRALEIIRDRSLFPDSVIERYNLYKSSSSAPKNFDVRFELLMNNCND